MIPRKRMNELNSATRYALAVYLLSLLSACTATVSRIDPPASENTRPVFLIDHGRHASLGLTQADGSLVRYAYGEWRWYALQETGVFRAFPALFARTQAALGRQFLDGPPDETSIRHQVPVEIDEVHHLNADAERLDRLIENLDERYASALNTRHYNPNYRIEYVHDARPYTLRHNSNHVVAEWLEELGLEVRGNPVIGRWRVAE